MRNRSVHSQLWADRIIGKPFVGAGLCVLMTAVMPLLITAAIIVAVIIGLALIALLLTVLTIGYFLVGAKLLSGVRNPFRTFPTKPSGIPPPMRQ